jgi:hypothetical protein
MGLRTFVEGWPVYRPLAAADSLGRGATARSGRSARLDSADAVVKSVCPYCAVGCGQDVYAKDSAVIQIEGDPESPVRWGRPCPKGSPHGPIGRVVQLTGINRYVPVSTHIGAVVFRLADTHSFRRCHSG